MTETPTVAAPAAAWQARAEELADWALARLFVRTDRFGGYYCKGGETKKSARPNRGCREAFSRDLLVRHFRAAGTAGVLGAYALTPGEGGTGRWVGVDIDAHGPADDPGRNERYARHLYAKLAALGFRVLLVTWGTGGYHIWVLFDRDVPGPVLHAFGRWLVMDAGEFGFPGAVETFPKQAVVPDGRFGSFLRVPGRHHTRAVFASVFDGAGWVEGEAAVAHLLGLTGDPPDLIPPGAAPAPRKEKARAARAAGKARKAAGTAAGGPDVFAAYNATVTPDEVAGWHEDAGHRVLSRTPDRVEFARAGKDGANLSFNVKVIGGVPVTFNFSTNAGMPVGGLSPSQVRCFYRTGGCDSPAMAAFAAVLREELGWPADPPRVTITGSGLGDGKIEAADKVTGKDGKTYRDPPKTNNQTESQVPTVGTCESPDAGRDGDHHPAEDTGEPAEGAEPGSRFRDTDLANAARFAADHRDSARWVGDWRRWAVWDGRRWAVDASGALVAGLAQQTVRGMERGIWEALAAAGRAATAAGCEAEEAAAEKALAAARRDLAWVKQSQAASRLSAMAELAKPGLLIPKGADAFDRHQDLLNVPNGTVDLKTGELRPHRRDDFLTKLCPTPFDPNATCPTYKAFLSAVLPDEATANYVRELGGYACTGEVSDQSVILFVGKGSNGKSVLLDLWTHVLGEGEYAVSAPAELIADDGENRHPTEKTLLRGARLAACQESGDAETLNAKRVKHLTGGSMITARGMRQDFYSFPPTHTLVLATNSLPRVKTNDHATWRRIRVVKFPRVFWSEADRRAKPDGEYPEELRADPGLPDRLRAEAPGVLADMVAHAVEFYANGRRLTPPRTVGAAVADYREAEDLIGRYLREHVAPGDPGQRVRAVPFYTDFAAWYREEVDPEGRDCPGSKTFLQRAADRFGEPKLSGGRMLHAVRLLRGQPQPAAKG